MYIIRLIYEELQITIIKIIKIKNNLKANATNLQCKTGRKL